MRWTCRPKLYYALSLITAILDVDVSGHTMIPVPRRGKNKINILASNKEK